MNLTSMFAGRQRVPVTILRLYVTTAVISVVTIILMSGFSFYRILSGFVIKSAKEDSVQICSLLSNQQHHYLFRNISGPGEQLAIDRQALAQIDSKMREFLQPFNIIKVKIYDAERRIIYSTESSLIGKIDEYNRRLGKALAGNVDAKLVTREKARDLANEPLMDVDVVETYVPIRSTTTDASALKAKNSPDAGKVLGSFEIYVNVTKYREQIFTGMVVMTTITVAVLAAVFGFTFILIRRRTVQLNEAQAKLEKLAITDGLTGVANRGYVMKRGEEEFTRAGRINDKGTATSSLCCIMLDIDHFKMINDTKGHPAGDEVLREVVNRMRKSVRPYDIVGRYGGEEFLLLLPDTLFKEAIVVAERIRTDIHKEPIQVCGDEVNVSVSLGIAVFDEKDRKLDDLLNRADEGLYKAKNRGRNRVEWVYNPLETETFA